MNRRVAKKVMRLERWARYSQATWKRALRVLERVRSREEWSPYEVMFGGPVQR